MKINRTAIAAALVCVMAFLAGCGNIKVPDKVSGTNYASVIEKGLQSEGLDVEDKLYEQGFGDGKIIVFAKEDALGFAFMTKSGSEWTWQRQDPFYSAGPASTKPPYTAMAADLDAPHEKKLCVFMGRIFDDRIYRLAIDSGVYEAIIKPHKKDVFWFVINEWKSTLVDIKAYDETGNELKFN